MDKTFKKLSSADSWVILDGLSEIDQVLKKGVDPENLPLMFDAVTSLFYIDPFDRPDLLAAIDKALQTVAKMGPAAIPLILSSISDADIKAELNFARSCGLMDENAIEPLKDAFNSAKGSDALAFALYAFGKIKSPKIVSVLPLVLDAVNSPKKKMEDTAVRALGKICESINPDDLDNDTKELIVLALVNKVTHSNDVIRSKAIRSLGKLIRYGFADDIQKNRIMSEVRSILGLDEDRNLDQAYLVRREAQEILETSQ